jgi:hypothetical protein
LLGSYNQPLVRFVLRFQNKTLFLSVMINKPLDHAIQSRFVF